MSGSCALNVLGLDTSTAASSVCVLRADGRPFEFRPDPEMLSGPPAHARELMPRIASQLHAAELSYADLDAIAIGVGPGAYTGLRIGIATARAVAQARGVPVRAVGSLAALAEGIAAEVALPLIDARRGELFAAAYVRGQERLAPFVGAPDAVIERLGELRVEGLPRPLAAGDGSLRFQDALEAASIDVVPAGSSCHVVRALHVCRLALTMPALAPEAVLPTYLRAPDATPR